MGKARAVTGWTTRVTAALGATLAAAGVTGCLVIARAPADRAAQDAGVAGASSSVGPATSGSVWMTSSTQVSSSAGASSAPSVEPPPPSSTSSTSSGVATSASASGSSRRRSCSEGAVSVWPGGCRLSVCNGSTMVDGFMDAGEPARTHVRGDCHRRTCNGAGGIQDVADDGNGPSADGTCAPGTCDGGEVVPLPPRQAGDPCGAGRFCDRQRRCTGECAMGAVQCWDGGGQACGRLARWEPATCATACVPGTRQCVTAEVSAQCQADGGLTGVSCVWGCDVRTGACATVTDLDVGVYVTCVTTSAAQLWCWGCVDHATPYATELDAGVCPLSPVPRLVAGVSADAVAAGTNHVCVRAMDGGVLCWGANNSGQLGLGTITSVPVAAPPAVPAWVTGATALAHGKGAMGCATVDGGLACWGMVGLMFDAGPAFASRGACPDRSV